MPGRSRASLLLRPAARIKGPEAYPSRAAAEGVGTWLVSGPHPDSLAISAVDLLSLGRLIPFTNEDPKKSADQPVGETISLSGYFFINESQNLIQKPKQLAMETLLNKAKFLIEWRIIMINLPIAGVFSQIAFYLPAKQNYIEPIIFLHIGMHNFRQRFGDNLFILVKKLTDTITDVLHEAHDVTVRHIPSENKPLADIMRSSA